LVIDSKTKQVICVAIGKGRKHDLDLLKVSQTRFALEVLVKADKGYQGIKKLHSKSETPHKKPRGGKLTREQRAENRVLARERIVVEHVNRRFKVFRVLSEVYRNRRSRYGLRVNLVAGIYNLDCVDGS
jgi:IS5 family transposase